MQFNSTISIWSIRVNLLHPIKLEVQYKLGKRDLGIPDRARRDALEGMRWWLKILI